MSFLDTLDPKYRLILCDLWGVVHDGVELYPGAADRLRQWRANGRSVVLVTNAPRPTRAIEAQLNQLGLPSQCWDAIVSSGKAGIEALKALGAPVGFIGTAGDREVLEGSGLTIAEGDAFTDLACTGLRTRNGDPQGYRGGLGRLATRDVHMHCLNPDRVVIHGGIAEACAGALGDIYEGLGGRVTWYGKPFPAIYDHALQCAGNPSREEVLAIGDGLETDMLGAARMGFDAIFVTGGIHAGEAFPEDFAERNGLGDWRPVAVVTGLG